MASEEHFHDFSVRYPTKGMEHILGCTGCSAVQWGVPVYQLSDAAREAVRDESLAMECLRLHDEIDTLKAKIARMEAAEAAAPGPSRWDASAFDLYNEYRQWRGLGPLTVDEFCHTMTNGPS